MTFVTLGIYHANVLGQTTQLIPLPDVNGDPQPFLTWGYSAQPNPGQGTWIETPDLREEPFGVSAEATAVRLHIKAKAKTIKWTTVDSIGDIQVAVKEWSILDAPNECVHANACQKANDDLPGENISSIVLDVPIGENGKVAIFHYPSIIGYANVELGIYLSGYWALPVSEPLPPQA